MSATGSRRKNVICRGNSDCLQTGHTVTHNHSWVTEPISPTQLAEDGDGHINQLLGCKKSNKQNKQTKKPTIICITPNYEN